MTPASMVLAVRRAKPRGAAADHRLFEIPLMSIISQKTIKTPIPRQVAMWATAASVLWGASYVAAKYVVGWIPPLTAAAFRFGVVAVICLPLLWITRKGQKIERGDWAGLVMVGLFQTSFYFALQYAGIRLTTASNTSVIVNVRPVFAAILSAIVLHESISSRKLGGILLAFALGALLVLIGAYLTTSAPAGAGRTPSAASANGHTHHAMRSDTKNANTSQSR